MNTTRLLMLVCANCSQITFEDSETEVETETEKPKLSNVVAPARGAQHLKRSD